MDFRPEEEAGVTGISILSGIKTILEEAGDDQEELKKLVHKNITELIPKHITKEDIIASINYNMHLEGGIGTPDDIDHLGNRRIRCRW